MKKKTDREDDGHDDGGGDSEMMSEFPETGGVDSPVPKDGASKEHDKENVHANAGVEEEKIETHSRQAKTIPHIKKHSNVAVLSKSIADPS